MAWKEVFNSLVDAFKTEVDFRILKAVAVEYCNDADEAALFIVSEVLPLLSEPQEPHYCLNDDDDDDLGQLKYLDQESIRSYHDQMLKIKSADDKSNPSSSAELNKIIADFENSHLEDNESF